MSKWYSVFPKNPVMSWVAWVALCLIPFYLIFHTASRLTLSVALAILIMYLICFRFAYSATNGLVYMWIAFGMVINAVMTVLFGYIFFAFFTAFSIGKIHHTVGFYIMYGLHIAMTVGSVIGGFFIETDLFIQELPLIVIILFSAILGPFYLFSESKSKKLEGALETANARISELSVYEERQRIARDLHDTLGQKLSMIGLKSDLAVRLVKKDQEAAISELHDIRQTSSIALKEVREMVSNMKKVKLQEEISHVQQILIAANIQLKFEGNPQYDRIPTMLSNSLSMCLKEAVNNVVRHSQATECKISILQSADFIEMIISDNGIGISKSSKRMSSNGLNGMKERVEFVNGELEVSEDNGTTVRIIVPIVITHD
ncbi:sensor histidine kinase [uncultured Rummeliibacillus sp.]|uniref:sensor histidine kinase n=1 Tax=uncultured Rummeliibacillus sp. TaxID=762292 RepID=UPI002626C773|nr:sensor histidine kinase [uncultured Rummeliibacillus sp.]